MKSAQLTFFALATLFIGIVAFYLIPLLSVKPELASVVANLDTNSGTLDPTAHEAFYDGKKVELPSVLVLGKDGKSQVLGVSNLDSRWIEVDLSEQKLRAWDGNTLFLESLVSTGLPWWPTPTGEFRIWLKLRATRMEGGSGRYYYNLPNVPYVMFFENDKTPGYRGFGLHGTYWHHDFGKPHSHGCVNLPTDVAEKLYYWTSPVMPAGRGIVRADEGNVGTRIVIHD